MWKILLLAIPLSGLLHGAVVLDRISVIVGKRVVKSSDVDRNLRVSQFLNQEPLKLTNLEKKKVASRLIDQEIIRQEMMNGGYSQPTGQDAEAYLKQLRADRFKGSDPAMRAALTQYGLTEDQLRTYFLWQLTVLDFIDQRFRPGVLVTDEDVKTYYEQHKAALQKANPKGSSLEALDAKLREVIAGERVNQNFEEWLTQTRRRIRVVYRDAAIAEPVPPPAVTP